MALSTVLVMGTLVDCGTQKAAEMAVEFILEKLNGKGNLVEVQGIPGVSATRDRGQGFHYIVDKKELLNLLLFKQQILIDKRD